MNRRIFLDVGAHNGETLAAVLDMNFHEIVCFEPVKHCWQRLEKIQADLNLNIPQIRIERFGLWNKTCDQVIFAPDSKGPSLWKKDKAKSEQTELCQFCRASDWFRGNLVVSDVVFMKLNVEGAECDILDDLLDSCEFTKINFVMIDFDVRKIASQKHREAELRSRLARFKFPQVAYSRDVMVGPTHAERIKNWLRMIGAANV